MQKIGEIKELIDQKDLRSSIQDGYRERRSYTTTSKGTKPPVARFKVKVYFTDGNTRYFYSYDYQTGADGSRIHDEWLGLSTLLHQRAEWIEQRKITGFYIYANLDQRPNTEDRRYNTPVYESFLHPKAGQWVIREYDDVNFVIVEDSTILKLRQP